MRKYFLSKENCRHCSGEIPQGNFFCRFCSRDRLFGIKKWEYIGGGVAVLVLLTIGGTSIAGAINILSALSIPNKSPLTQNFSPTFASSPTLSQDFPLILTPSPTSAFLIIPSTPMLSYPSATQQISETEIVDLKRFIYGACAFREFQYGLWE